MSGTSSPPWGERGLPGGLRVALALLGLGLALYARAMTIGLVGDDFLFMDAALRTPLGELLSGRHGIVGFYRPVSRELYFWWWGRTLGLGPLALHVVNALTFAAVVALVYRIAARAADARAGALAALVFVLFPAGGALLAWISCAQDLIALFWALAALALAQDRRTAWAGVAVALAGLAKETALAAAAWPALAVVMLDRSGAFGDRVRRLAPIVAGVALAVVVQVAVRAGWPAGTAVAVWSPSQASGAWRLPWWFVRSLLPPDVPAGASQLLGRAPWLLLAAVACAVLVVPQHGPARARARAAAGSPGAGALARFGAAVWLTGLLPVAFVAERWRSYFFDFAAVGWSFAAGAWLSRAPRPLAWGVVAAMAVVHLSANSVYRPLPGEGPARHAFVNVEFFRQAEAATAPLLASLRGWCDSLRAVPRVFATGVPPDAVYQTVLGVGARATCRDSGLQVRFLAELTPEDAGTSFGILRPDPRRPGFVFERVTARTRARIAEGFLLYGRYPLARACYEAAAGTDLDGAELAYPLACARAADRDSAAARAGWDQARRMGAIVDAASLAYRLAATRPPGVPPESLEAARADLRPRVGRALAEPWSAAAHRALAGVLGEHRCVRAAALEWAIAAGISRSAEDLVGLAEAYEAVGALDEARSAYEAALAQGLPRPVFTRATRRYMALGRRETPPAAPGALPGFGGFPQRR